MGVVRVHLNIVAEADHPSLQYVPRGFLELRPTSVKS